ncbi:hypothetical protein ACFQ1E_20280 [Sphingomonas canadensis]|uniref:Uncharacterized protein n=2 Tax=Sphingomonas canadensis TaxID=1219257 RepID=A0ABW3HC31_9SPHN|nr:hypothetical protein [Sphingomonas canadensis]
MNRPAICICAAFLFGTASCSQEQSITKSNESGASTTGQTVATTDPFVGEWFSPRAGLRIAISRDGSGYFIQGHGTTTDSRDGGFPATKVDGRLQTNTPYGDITYRESADRIYWTGSEFVRQNSN